MDDVNPITDFNPANERQDFIGRQIEGVQRQPEIGVFDEREKPEGAVLDPLQNHCIRTQPDLGFHKRRELAQRLYVVAIIQQDLAVRFPGGEHGFCRVVEQIDIVREAGGRQYFVQGGPYGDVPFAVVHAFCRQKTADAPLVGG